MKFRYYINFALMIPVLINLLIIFITSYYHPTTINMNQYGEGLLEIIIVIFILILTIFNAFDTFIEIIHEEI